MDEFEQLMAASAQPDLLDDHGVMSSARGQEDAMTPEPVMHSRQMNALGITPPRSLLSSFTAAARSGAMPVWHHNTRVPSSALSCAEHIPRSMWKTACIQLEHLF